MVESTVQVNLIGNLTDNVNDVSLMDSLTPWEEETLAILHDMGAQEARTDADIEKTEARLLALQGEKEQLRYRMECTEVILGEYRRKYEIARNSIDHNPVLESEYAHLRPSDIIQRWASKHDGHIVMRDLCRAMVAAGIYPEYQPAAATLYSVLRRMPAVIKKERGQYLLPNNKNGLGEDGIPMAAPNPPE